MILHELVQLVGQPFGIGAERLRSDEPKRGLVRKRLQFDDDKAFNKNIRELELPYWARTIGMGVGFWKEKSGWKAVYLQVREARYEYEDDMRQWMMLYSIDASRARRLASCISLHGGSGELPPAYDQDSCESQAGKGSRDPVIAELKMTRPEYRDWGAARIRARRCKTGLRFEAGRTYTERYGGGRREVTRWTRDTIAHGIWVIHHREKGWKHEWITEPTPEVAKELLTMHTVSALVPK